MDITYIDRFIADGEKAVISLRNLYDTTLVTQSSDSDHIFRIPLDDFFLKHRSELNDIIQIYTLPIAMYYKPKLLSKQLYGTTELWLALLRVNNMQRITEFQGPVVKVYSPSSLKELIKVYFKRENKR